MSRTVVFRTLVLCLALTALASLPVQAQEFVAVDGFSGGGGMAAKLASMTGSVVKLLRVLLGIGALAAIAFITIKVMGGDREAPRKYVWWVVGLAYGLTMLSVLNGLVGKAAGASGKGSFGAFHGEVKGVVMVLLCYACMFALVKGLYAVMRGHSESMQTTFGWTLTTVLAMTVISAL